MKKILSLVTIGTLLFSMVGCSDGDDDVAETITEPEEIVVEEKEIETEPVGSSDIDKLANDLYSFQIRVNNQVYQFPMSFDTFEELGWEYQEDATESLEASSYITAQSAEMDNIKVFVDVINFAPETRLVNESYIGGMTFETYYLNDADVEIVLPSDITFGEASLEEIETAYGKPSDIYQADSLTVYSYGADIYEEIKFTVFNDTGVLEKIDIRNFAEPDDLVDAEVVTDAPEQIANYEYPELISNDLFDYHTKYDGIIYQMPIPVVKLFENGWKDADSEEGTLASGRFSTINLIKDNQTVRCHLMNYFDFVTIPENTHVTKIESRSDGPNIPIELAHGITLGMKQEELEQAIHDYTYEVEDNSMFTAYRIDDPNVVNSGITLLVDAETNEISSIIVQYDPETLD